MAIDPITTSMLTPLLSTVAKSIAEGLKLKTGALTEKIKINLEIGFGNYVSQQIQRYSHVKTIISGNTPVKLEDVYVNLYLSSGNKKYRDDDFINENRSHKNFVFCATAGAGKSMLMRYLYFSFLKEDSVKLPVFFELRELNDNKDKSLFDILHSKISEYIENFTEKQMRYALEKGIICLFLDGYDEIDHDNQKKRSR